MNLHQMGSKQNLNWLKRIQQLKNVKGVGTLIISQHLMWTKGYTEQNNTVLAKRQA